MSQPTKKVTVATLRARAKELSIPKYYKMKKVDLTNAIAEAEELDNIFNGVASTTIPEPQPIVLSPPQTLPVQDITSSHPQLSKSGINIYHIADLHLNEYTRFKHFLEKLNESPAGIVVIAGDMFHKYDSLNTPLIKIGYGIVSVLAERHTVIIIPGNHDGRNLQMKAPFVSWIAERIPNAYYLTENIVYRFSGLHFLHIPYWDSDTAIRCVKTNIHPLVGLYHESLVGARTDQGRTFRGDELITVKDFEQFDICMMGHIHKHQFLAKNIAYSGSLAQTNFGETVDMHGYIRWTIDLTDGSFISEFVEVFSNQLYLTIPRTETIKSSLNRVPEWEYRMNYVDRVNLRFDDARDDTGIKAMDDEYPNLQIIQVKDNYDIVRGNIADTNLNSEARRADDIEEFERYTVSHTPRGKIEQVVPPILDLHRRLKTEAQITENENVSMWNLVSLEFMNVFGYGGDVMHKIQMNPDGEIIHISGKNGLGKSSIMSILSYALFNTGYRTNAEDIMNHDSSSYKISVKFMYGTTQYMIINSGKRGEKSKRISISVEFYQGDDKLSHDRKWINTKLVNLLGNVKEFRLINIMSAGISTNVTSLSPTDRTRALTSIFRFNIYDKVRELAMKSKISITREIDTANGKILGLNQIANDYNLDDDQKNVTNTRVRVAEQAKVLAELNHDVAELNKKRSTIDVVGFDKSLSEDISKYNVTRISASTAAIKIAETHVRTFELTNLRTKYNAMEDIITSAKEEVAAAENEVDKYEQPSSAYVSLTTELNHLAKDIKTLSDERTSVESRTYEIPVIDECVTIETEIADKEALVESLSIKFAAVMNRNYDDEPTPDKCITLNLKIDELSAGIKTHTVELSGINEQFRTREGIVPDECHQISAEIKHREEDIKRLASDIVAAKSNPELDKLRTIYRAVSQNLLENKINKFVTNEKLFRIDEHKLLRQYFLETRESTSAYDATKLAAEIKSLEKEQATTILTLTTRAETLKAEIEFEQKRSIQILGDYKRALETKRTDAIHSVAAQIKLLEVELDTTRETLRRIESEYRRTFDSKRTNDLQEITSQTNSITAEIKTLRGKIVDILSEHRREFDTIRSKDLHVITTKLDSLVVKSESIRDEIDALESKRIDKLASANSTLREKSGDLKSLLTTRATKLAEIDSERYNGLTENKNLTRSVIDTYNNLKLKHTMMIHKITSGDIPDKFNTQHKKLLSMMRTVDDIGTEIIQKRDQIHRTETTIQSFRREIDVISARISDHARHVKAAEDIETMLIQLNGKKAVIERYIKLIAPAKFPAHMNQIEMELIISSTNTLLSAIGIELQIAYTDAKFMFIKHNEVFPIGSASGYENFIINLAIKIVLQKFTRNSVSKLMFIDEGLDCVGDENLMKFTDLIHSILPGTAFMITHSPRFGNIATRKIEVLSDPTNGSFLNIM